MMTRENFQKLIDHFGGSQKQTAKSLKVKQATVSGWLNEKHRMSLVVALRAQKVTGGKIKASELCEVAKDLESDAA